MRINRNTILVGDRVVLVPYRKQHVTRYHEWMKDPLIQEQTASEPLSLEQEYEMQQSWAVDEDKLTFIILAKQDAEQIHADKQTDVLGLIKACQMVGDVNLFFNQRHEDQDEDEHQDGEGQLSENKKPAVGPEAVLDAECEIMVAESSYRRKGIAREALQMMFAFVTSSPTPTADHGSKTPPAPSMSQATGGVHCTLPIPSDWLSCKISLTNHASISLFESLGFTRQKVSQVWQEVEMRCTNLAQTPAPPIRSVLFWPDE